MIYFFWIFLLAKIWVKTKFQLRDIPKKWVKSNRRRRKKEREKNTPGTRVGPASMTLKSRKK